MNEDLQESRGRGEMVGMEVYVAYFLYDCFSDIFSIHLLVFNI